MEYHLVYITISIQISSLIKLVHCMIFKTGATDINNRRNVNFSYNIINNDRYQLYYDMLNEI